jgi:hypothetical protein
MLILNLQFWEGDKAQAMALARLLADIELAPRHDVHFLFTSRFDCEHDEATVEYVTKKFPKCYKLTTKRKATGWPNGPNQMMGESYESIITMIKRGTGFRNATGIMFIEADCVPLHRNWISLLSKEWEDCGKAVLGAWLKAGDAGMEHINGNCIINTTFWKKCAAIMHPASKGGWDASLRYQILPNGYPSKLIWSDYRLGTTDNPWRGEAYLWEPKRYRDKENALYGQDLYPCWFHGIKGDMGIVAARRKFAL